MQAPLPFKKTLLSRRLTLAWAISLPSLVMPLLVGKSVYAEELTLQPIVVTANRTGQQLNEALPHTTLLTQEDITRSQAPDLISLLRSEAGFQSSQTGGIGQPASLFMRGAESRQTLVLIDGVRFDSQITGGSNMSQVMLDQIEKIEIVRGNVSSIYGSSAIGGVIQIFTKKGHVGNQANLTAEIGSRDSRKLAVGLNGQQGQTRYALNLSGLSTTGFSAANTAIFEGDNPDKDGYRQRTVQGSLSHELQPGHQLGANLYRTQGKSDYDNGFSTFTPNTATQMGKAVIQQTSLYSKNQITANWHSLITLSQSRDDYLTERNQQFNARYITQHQQVQWVNTVNVSGQNKLTAGFEQDQQKINSDNGFDPVLNRSRHVNSAYLGYQTQQSQHQLQINGRYDKTPDFGSATTYLLAYGYVLNDVWKLIANASTAFNAPLLAQLYAPNYGNADLKAERGNTLEWGAQYSDGAHLLRATLFKTKTRDQIDYDASLGAMSPYGFPYGLYINRAKTSNQGLELSYGGRVCDMKVNASLTLQNPKDDITGNTLQRRAKQLASVSLTKQWGAASLGGNWQYTDARPDVNYDAFPSETVSLKAYTLLNLHARYAMTKELAVYGRIENLLQKNYQTAYGYNQPSRGIFVGINWQPNF